MSSEQTNYQQWGLIGTLVWGAVVAIAYILVQAVALALYVKVVYGEISGRAFSGIEYNGDALALATFATLFICVPIVFGVVKLKKKSSLRNYLALNRVGSSSIVRWSLVIFGFAVLSDSLTWLLGKPIVPEFMSSTYISSSNPLWLILALLVAAPIFEELFFRGFLLSGFSRTFLQPGGAVVVTSLAWSSIHVQYDVYGILTIFASGVILGFARLKTNSTLTTIIMHALMNLIATVETIIYVSIST